MHESVQHKVEDVFLCIINELLSALGWIIVGIGVGFAINFKANSADN